MSRRLATLTLVLVCACSAEESETITLALDEVYSLGPTETIALEEPFEPSSIRCSSFPNGVVRSWHVLEKNKYDFRWSKHYCRNMESDGTLGPVYDFIQHFYNSGNGTYGISKIPLNRLPVGVRLRLKQPGSGFSISDVALLHNRADDIFAGSRSYTQAAFALGRSGTTRTLECPRGAVMRTISVTSIPRSGGPNQSRISNVAIHCSPLEIR